MTKPKTQSEFKLTPAQRLLSIHLRELGFYDMGYEVMFNTKRKWRLDIVARVRILQMFRDPAVHLCAFEASGGARRGGHRRGDAQADEYLKLNSAQILGYTVFQFTNEQILKGEALAFLKEWVKP